MSNRSEELARGRLWKGIRSEMNIRSVAEYINIIDEFRRKTGTDNDECRFLYRGHTNQNGYELLPGLFRRTNKGDNRYIREYNQDQKSMMVDYGYKYSQDDLDENQIIEKAQHHQVPSSRLDFSEDPFVALYFACVDQNHENDYPSVWLLDKNHYLEFFFNHEHSVDSSWDSKNIVRKIDNDETYNRIPGLHNDAKQYVINPYIYKPDWIDPREITQKSWFMLWGARQDPLDEIVNLNYGNVISLENYSDHNSDQILGVITIDPNYRLNIISELSAMGYVNSYIYPNKDDHGKQIKFYNTNDENTQCVERRFGGGTLTFQEANPTKDNWRKENE